MTAAPPPPGLAGLLGLDGDGVLFADERDAARLVAGCRAAGYTVVEVDTAGVTEFRTAQARIADALRLPGNADRNLDALADELTELARYWPWDDRLVLLWRHPEELIAADAAGWCRLADVLAEATERRFETLLLIRGYDG